MLGYRDLEWYSVETSIIMPRPWLMPLSGGYRRVPVAQIGPMACHAQQGACSGVRCPKTAAVARWFFTRGLEGGDVDVVLGEDGMHFRLPPDSETIEQETLGG